MLSDLRVECVLLVGRTIGGLSLDFRTQGWPLTAFERFTRFGDQSSSLVSKRLEQTRHRYRAILHCTLFAGKGRVKSATMEKSTGNKIWMTLLFKHTVIGDLNPEPYRATIFPLRL
jgi:hypothetical protein